MCEPHANSYLPSVYMQRMARTPPTYHSLWSGAGACGFDGSDVAIAAIQDTTHTCKLNKGKVAVHSPNCTVAISKARVLQWLL